MTRPESAIADFLARIPLRPDPFQLDAMEAIERGEAVVVTAPTGAGKTLIAAAAVHLAVRRGRRAFYTTPIKALSNQKFVEFRQSYGLDQVGLLTGDNVINADAPVVVMTTEVLRNMIYARSPALETLDVVVLDEVHYLQDRYRGPVWEEVIIHLPRRVQLVSLSATIANPEEFTEWVAARRGPTTLVVETRRPVPLESRYMVVDRAHEGAILLEPVFEAGGRRPNRRLQALLRKGRGRFRRFVTPRRVEVVEHLRAEGLLPAIYFIFSRAGCDQAATLTAAASLGFTTPAERLEIRRIAEARTGHIPLGDLAALGFDGWVQHLEQGVAAHHAGMVPAFKETVEELFAAGLLQVVFATETLALGINMPARTVVLESLSRFTGERHELLRPGDYTQLTGRAGRRGIDEAGTAVVLHSRFIRFEKVAEIAAAGSHPLVSSFQPTYNMAVNLVAGFTEERAVELLAASFASFHLERRRRLLAERLVEAERRVDELAAAATCERGDLDEYLAAAEPAATDALRAFVRTLRPGAVLRRPDGVRWVLLARGTGPDPRLSMVSDRGEARRFRARDLGEGVTALGRLELPRPIDARSPRYRETVVRLLAAWEPEGPERTPAPSTANPVASCSELSRHLAARRGMEKARREVRRLRRRIARGDDDLLERFRATIGLLRSWSYVDGWSLTERGRRLRFVYNERDLLLTECAMRGHLTGLDTADFAAIASLFTYERRSSSDEAPAWPTDVVRRRAGAVDAVWKELVAEEAHRGLPTTSPPDGGFARLAHDWAAGADLADVFEADEIGAGDFVRNCRQLLDLLRQIRDAFPELSSRAAAAVRAVDRGIVAAGGIE